MINDLFMQPDFDQSKLKVSFTKPENCFRVDYEILDGDVVVKNGSIKTGRTRTPVVFEEKLPFFKPWSVKTPFLYLLKLVLHKSEGVTNYEHTFGMWKIHIRDNQIYFNNRPFFLRGFIRGREAHDHPNLTGRATTEYYEKNIKMAKAFGFNFIRFHSIVPPPEFFDAADRLGILCHAEVRKYYGKYQKERNEDFDGDQTLVDENDWAETIRQLRNHPSLMVYCLGNEINNPGNNTRVKHLRSVMKSLDPSRLFLDSCSRGEYDRDTIDIDVQHMSYFAPFGKHYNMFDDSVHLSLYGSVTGRKMVQQDTPDNPSFVMRREISLKVPLIAHEVAHYNVLRNPYELDAKFKKYHADKPWWIDELIKMIKAKGYEKQYKKMLEASTRFQYIWIKQALESIRKSPILNGFHFLQLSDTDRYENANGLLDCFDDIKDISPESILAFNSSTVVVADLPRRSFAANTQIQIPVFVSHYSTGEFESASLSWELKSKRGNGVSIEGEMDNFDLSKGGNRPLCRIDINLPMTEKPEWLIFSCVLHSDNKKYAISNQWDLWLFPDKPERIKPFAATIFLNNLKIYKRYPQVVNKGTLDNPEQLLITDRFNEQVIKHLERGKDVLVIYRIAENRNKQAPGEKYYLPSTWERFKGIIWDRGHNCGGFLKEHPIIRDFPHDGFINWQFYNLIEDSDKIDLDDFPLDIEPIIAGVDKAVRDRFDVNRFNLPEFQYAYTMRKFAYLFELNAGKGRLVITGMNLKGIEDNIPEVCWMFESIINYMNSSSFKPEKSIPVKKLADYLLEKGKAGRIKERMMTQYWQLDDAPLESKRYWEESEKWLREKE